MYSITCIKLPKATPKSQFGSKRNTDGINVSNGQFQIRLTLSYLNPVYYIKPNILFHPWAIPTMYSTFLVFSLSDLPHPKYY